MDIGPWEIGLILVVVLLIFGGGKIATIGRDLGKAIRGFKEESRGPSEEATGTKSIASATTVKEEASDAVVKIKPVVKAVAKKTSVATDKTA
jgi:sec-independent protein translocase protein TatA